MATKEDILEQIVEEYLVHKRYFVRHNLKFRPKRGRGFDVRKHSNHSDIDVLAIHPLRSAAEKVWAVSCKSWQGGFDPAYWLRAIKTNKTVSGRPAWKAFRELTAPTWAKAFRDEVLAATGSKKFTYVVAVAHVKGSSIAWERHPPFLKALGGNPIRVITFRQMVTEIQGGLTKTLEGTEVGRMLQMFQAAGYDFAGTRES